jgi:transposase
VLGCLRDTIPNLSRSALHRCLQRHGISKRNRFKTHQIGHVHRFEVEFTDEPGVRRIVWLFSMVLGYSRLIRARFVVHQDLQSVLRCHITALAAIGGAPRTILYDRMKTAVVGEDTPGGGNLFF